MPSPRPVLIGLPYDASSSFLRGAAAAPPLIRQAMDSPSSNAWSESGLEIVAGQAFVDAGDGELPPHPNARESIEKAIATIVRRGDIPISLGGDHSVTYPILRAVGPRHDELTVLQFD